MLQDQSHAREYERTVRLLLAVVLVLGAGLRVWMALVLPRYFDDHYVFNNIAPFLNGSLRPRHSYYGTLSYLPQALALKLCDFLHSRTGIAALAVHGTRFEGFTLGAFRIMRMFIVLYALLSILMIYRVGRRLFSPTVGLAAAAVLAAYPQHLRSSIQLKPDMMALMFTLLTLYWTAGAARAPRLSRFLLSGVGVGLGDVGQIYRHRLRPSADRLGPGAGRRDRRLWAWLPLAGGASVATFFLLNPFFGLSPPLRIQAGQFLRSPCSRANRAAIWWSCAASWSSWLTSTAGFSAPCCSSAPSSWSAGSGPGRKVFRRRFCR